MFLKLLVPSKGSTCQTTLLSPVRPVSSPFIEWSGNFSLIILIIVCSDSSSAILTTVLSFFSEKTTSWLKYFKITGADCDLGCKQEYFPSDAEHAAAEHAGDFLVNRIKQIENLGSNLERKPIVVSTYDAELFGHWWFEGVDFIENLFRKIHYDQDVVELITPSEYLQKEKNSDFQKLLPADSSWGDRGYYSVWLNGSNDWIYKDLHKIAGLMIEMADKYKNVYINEKEERVLNQMARELLLAQASDWAFIISANTVTEYAIKRTKDHVTRFWKLYDFLKHNNIDETILKDYEFKDNIFSEIDFRVYC